MTFIREGSLYRRLAQNSAVLAAGTAAAALLTMIAVILSARALSTHEYGVLVLFQSATMLISAFMSFGTQQPLMKLGAEAQHAGDLKRLGRLLRLGLVLDAVAATMAAVIGALLVQFAGPLFGLPPEYRGTAFLFAGALLFMGYQSSNGIFRLLNRFGTMALIQVVSAAMMVAAAALLHWTGAGFLQFALAWAAFFAVTGILPLLVAMIIARRQGIRPFGGKLEQDDTQTFVTYCWSTWGSSTLEGTRMNADSLIVGALVSVPAAAIYNVAKQLAGVLRKANGVYASAVFPEISALAARGATESALIVRSRLIKVGFLIGLAAVSAAVLVGGPVIELLFGNRFADAHVPLIILSAAAGSQLIGHTLSMYTQVYVGPKALVRIIFFAFLIFVAAVLPLTHLFAANGTALAQLIFSVAAIVLCALALRRSAPSSDGGRLGGASGNSL